MTVLHPRTLFHVAFALVIWKQVSFQIALALRAVDCVILGLRLSDLSIPEFYHSKPHISVWVLMGTHSGDEVSYLSVMCHHPKIWCCCSLNTMSESKLSNSAMICQPILANSYWSPGSGLCLLETRWWLYEHGHGPLHPALGNSESGESRDPVEFYSQQYRGGVKDRAAVRGAFRHAARTVQRHSNTS